MTCDDVILSNSRKMTQYKLKALIIAYESQNDVDNEQFIFKFPPQTMKMVQNINKIN